MGFGSRFAGRAEDGGEVSEGDAGREDLRSLSLSRRGEQPGGRGSLERQACGGEVGGCRWPAAPG